MDNEPNLVTQVTSLDMMLTLVAAGYGLGFVTAAQMAAWRHPGVVVRPILNSSDAVLTTYVLRLETNTSEHLHRFFARMDVGVNAPVDLKSAVWGKSVSVG